MATAKTAKFEKKRASSLINIETYTQDDCLVITKAPGDKTYVGRAYVCSPLVGGGSEFTAIIDNLFKSCPDDSIVQVSLMAVPEFDAPARIQEGKVHGGAMVQELVARQAQLFQSALKVGWQPDVPALNRRQLVLSLMTPVKSLTAEALVDAASFQSEFHADIKGCGFADAKAVSAEELAALYRLFTDPTIQSHAHELDQLVEWKYQVFGPDLVIDFRDEKLGKFGDTFCASVTVKDYPEFPYQGISSLMTGAPFNQGATKEGGGQRIMTPFIFTTTIRVANQRKEQDRLEAAIKSRQNTQSLPFKLGNEDPEKTLHDLNYMRKLCSTDGDKFVFVTTTAFLYGQNAEVTQDAAIAVKSSLDKLGFDARIVRTDGLVRWCQALPLNFSVTVAENLKYEAIMGSSAAGTLLPVYGDYQGNARRDTHYGVPFIARRGSVYTFDPYQTSGNFNGTAVAPPGKGKSFVLQYLIYFALAEGTNVFLIDNGRSSKKFCHAVGGEFNDFNMNTQDVPSLNPFTGLANEEFDQQFEGITSLIMLMAFGSERPQAGATIALSEAVRAAWSQQQGDAEITHVIEALESINRNAFGKQETSEVEQASLNLVPRLRAFVSSPTRGIYFKGAGSIDIRKQFTVFEMAGLAGDEHLRKCVTFFILNMLMNRIKNIKGRKMIVIDEAHDLFKDELAARAMEGIYLKGRKDGVSIWTIVQSLLKLTENEAGRVIINSSAWKLMLEQEPSEISGLFKTDILPKGDAYFERLVRSVETRKGAFSEILITNSRAYEVVRLYVDQFTGTLFSSEGEARDEVFDLMEQGIPAVDAVKRVMNAKGEAVKDLLSIVLEQIQHEYPNVSKLDLLKSFKEAIN